MGIKLVGDDGKGGCMRNFDKLGGDAQCVGCGWMEAVFREKNDGVLRF